MNSSEKNFGDYFQWSTNSLFFLTVVIIVKSPLSFNICRNCRNTIEKSGNSREFWWKHFSKSNRFQFRVSQWLKELQEAKRPVELDVPLHISLMSGQSFFCNNAEHLSVIPSFIRPSCIQQGRMFSKGHESSRILLLCTRINKYEIW
jgi:hypothetical protein